ncbi:Uncharacterized protein TCM_040928 isoform 2, partial [Theobroma cacao]
IFSLLLLSLHLFQPHCSLPPFLAPPIATTSLLSTFPEREQALKS